MTGSWRADLFSCQVAFSNSDLRHLFRNGSADCGQSSDSQLLIRYHLSTTYEDFKIEARPPGDPAPVKVPMADADREPSQLGSRCPYQTSDKCQFSIRLPDTSNRAA